MSHENYSRLPSTSHSQPMMPCTIETCYDMEEEGKTNKNKSLFSLVKKNGAPGSNEIKSMLCEDCSEFLNLKLAEAEGNLLGKEKIIHILKEQLIQLKDRNVKTIDEVQNVGYKFGIAKQELENVKQICTKYEEELQKLRFEKASKHGNDQLALKFKEDADRWKKQYEDLLSKINITEKSISEEIRTEPQTSDEEVWRNIIQNEVITAVNILKENSQSLINSLEKQNKKLEILVEKLQHELETSLQKEHILQKELHVAKNQLTEISVQTVQDKFDMKSADDTIKQLQQENDALKTELANITKLYSKMQQNYEKNLKEIEQGAQEKISLNSKYEDTQNDNKKLQSSLLELNKDMNKLKESYLDKMQKLQAELVGYESSFVYNDFIEKVNESLNTFGSYTVIEETYNTEGVIKACNDVIYDIIMLNRLNFEIEPKLFEMKISQSEYEKNELQSKLTEKIQELEHKYALISERDSTLNQTINENVSLKQKNSEFNEKIEILSTDLKTKEELVEIQSSKISDLKEILEDEIQKCNKLSIDNKFLKSEIEKEKSTSSFLLTERVDSQNEILSIISNLEDEKNSNKILSNENIELRNKLETCSKEKQAIEAQNIDIKTSFIDLENEKIELKEKLTNALVNIQGFQKALNANKEKINELVNVNKELQDKLKEQNQTDDRKLEDFQRKIDSLLNENKMLKTQIEQEKENSSALKKHIDSLQFYHENEKHASNTQLEDLKSEMTMLEKSYIKEINEIKEINKQSVQKLSIIEEENKKLYDTLNELNKDAQFLHKNVHNVSIPETYSGLLKVLNDDNIKLKNKVQTLENQLSEIKFVATTSNNSQKTNDNFCQFPNQDYASCGTKISGNHMQEINPKISEMANDFQQTEDSADIYLHLKPSQSVCKSEQTLDSNISTDTTTTKEVNTQTLEKESLEKIVEIDVKTQKVTEKDIVSDTSIESIRTKSILSSDTYVFSQGSTKTEINSLQRFSSFEKISEKETENLTYHEYKKPKNSNVNDEIALRVSTIETEINDLIDYTLIDEVKATSLPNLEVIKQHKDENTEKECECKGHIRLTRKTSSLENIRKNDDNKYLNTSQNTFDSYSTREKCDNRWDKQLDSLQKLRNELNDILIKLNIKKTKDYSECSPSNCSSKFKLVVDSLQRQVNELNIKSAEESRKCHGLQVELKGIRGNLINKEAMEEEIKRLKKELYKQKVESVQEIEKCRIRKEAEILEIQFQMREQFLEKKLKLLADLSDVQNALQKKTTDEKMLRERCFDLMKQVTINQEARNIKAQQLFLQPPTVVNVDPILQTGLREIFQTTPKQLHDHEDQEISSVNTFFRARYDGSLNKSRDVSDTEPTSVEDVTLKD